LDTDCSGGELSLGSFSRIAVFSGGEISIASTESSFGAEPVSGSLTMSRRSNFHLLMSAGSSKRSPLKENGRNIRYRKNMFTRSFRDN
jgi:hypothetical protein